jgi:hypothetical protein
MIFEARAFVLTGVDQRIGDRPARDHIMLMTDQRTREYGRTRLRLAGTPSVMNRPGSRAHCGVRTVPDGSALAVQRRPTVDHHEELDDSCEHGARGHVDPLEGEVLGPKLRVDRVGLDDWESPTGRAWVRLNVVPGSRRPRGGSLRDVR